MQVAALGDVAFAVSANTVNTLNSVKWEHEARYSEQDRHLKDPMVEFIGMKNDKISFELFFSKYLGVDPIQEYVKLLNIERSGKAVPFVLGTKAYGYYRWVITSTKMVMQTYDRRGDVTSAKVSVSLLAYPRR